MANPSVKQKLTLSFSCPRKLNSQLGSLPKKIPVLFINYTNTYPIGAETLYFFEKSFISAYTF